MKTISVTELRSLSQRNPDIKIIDVRTPVEHREIHLAGAALHPLNLLDPSAVASASKPGKPVYLLCRSGKRACAAAQRLAAAGLDDTVVIDGGIQAWEQAGLPVERGAKAVSLERQVRIAAGALVATGAALGFATGNPWWHGLSAFVGAGLVFAGITDTCGMGLLLARMPWNRAATACPAPATSTAA